MADLIIKNNIINRSQGSSLIFNSNKTSRMAIVSNNDYCSTGVTTSTIMLLGVVNTNLKQYNNYIAGTSYESN